MGFLDRLSVTWRIYGGFAGVMVLMGVLVLVGVLSLDRMAQGQRAALDGQALLGTVLNLERQASALELAVREFQHSGRQTALDTVRAREDTLRADLARLRARVDSPDRRELLLQMQAVFEDYMTRFGAVVDLRHQRDQLVADTMDRLGAAARRDLAAIRDEALAAGNPRAAAHAGRALNHLMASRAQALAFLADPGGVAAADLRPAVDAYVAAVNRLVDQLSDPGRRRLAENARQAAPAYEAAFDQVVAVVQRYHRLVSQDMAADAAAFAGLIDRFEDQVAGRSAERAETAQAESDWVILVTALVYGAILLLGLVLAGAIAAGVRRPLAAVTTVLDDLAAGREDTVLPPPRGGLEFAAMVRAAGVFRDLTRASRAQQARRAEIARISEAAQMTDSHEGFAREVLGLLLKSLNCGHGVFHVFDADAEVLRLVAAMGGGRQRNARGTTALGEGLTGLCARDRRIMVLDDIPEDYVRIGSGLGESRPRHLLLAPLVFQDRILAVVELAAFVPFDSGQRALIDELMPVLGLNLENLNRAVRTQDLLDQSRQQAEDLRASEEEMRIQREELRATNEELRDKTGLLERQAQDLRASEEELRVQREELQATNEELTEKTQTLEAQKSDLAVARAEAEQRNREIEAASRTKSEFLASMSHELRTPLNSLLVLARQLADDPRERLDDDQQEAARIILDSGTHLLHLINDILDLSKVEAGKIEIVPVTMAPAPVIEETARRYHAMATAQGLEMTVEIAPTVPGTMVSDPDRLQQILGNLLANAVRFTPRGRITVTAEPATGGECAAARVTGTGLAVRVADTGVGIATDDQARIFEAFEQAGTARSRPQGGTGLGLAIARQMARLLGGDVLLASEPEAGSVFTLVLPVASAEAPPAGAPAPVREAADAPPRHRVLVVDDDGESRALARSLLGEHGIDVADVATAEAALEWLDTGTAADCIILDLRLPGMDGFAFLDRVRERAGAAMPPVVVWSAMDLSREDNLRLREYTDSVVVKGQQSGSRLVDEVETFLGGAQPAWSETAEPEADMANHTVLVVDDDMRNTFALARLLRGWGLRVLMAQNGRRALGQLDEHPDIDLVLMDIMMPEMDGHEAIREIRRRPAWRDLPILALTAKAMAGDRDACLEAGANDYLPKPVDSARLKSLVRVWLRGG